MNAAILLITDGLEQRLHALIAEACAQEGLALVAAGSNGAIVLPVDCSLVMAVGILSAGGRQVPSSFQRLVAGLGVSVPLLVLCQEPLVSPMAVLDDGRLRLVGSPLTCAKIADQLRTVRPAVPGTSRLGRDTATAGRLQVREYRGPAWWAASLWRCDGSEEQIPQIDQTSGFAAILTAANRGTEAWPAPLTSKEPATRRFAQLTEKCGGGLALWFDPLGSYWHFAAPVDSEIWLHSSRRLPSHWRMRKDFTACEAVGEDLLVALRGAGGDVSCDQAAERGGPTLLDHLERRMAREPALTAAVVVELRP